MGFIALEVMSDVHAAQDTTPFSLAPPPQRLIPSLTSRPHTLPYVHLSPQVRGPYRLYVQKASPLFYSFY